MNGALTGISTELNKQLELEEALWCARDISDEKDRRIALIVISKEFMRKGDLQLAEKSGLDIPQNAERRKCFKGIAKLIKDKQYDEFQKLWQADGL